jgi:hypothetical protein
MRWNIFRNSTAMSRSVRLSAWPRTHWRAIERVAELLIRNGELTVTEIDLLLIPSPT